MKNKTLVTTYLTDADEAKTIADGIRKTISALGVIGTVTVTNGHVKVYTDRPQNIVKMRKILESVEASLGI